jgi:hypothetical protein
MLLRLSLPTLVAIAVTTRQTRSVEPMSLARHPGGGITKSSHAGV